jgi:hypothetical protein
MTTYDEAVRKWGVTRLSGYRNIKGKFDETSVTVDFELDSGFNCCGGSDPDCYCSMAESPSMKAYISYKGIGKFKPGKIEISYIDFAETLREMLEVP